MKRITAFQQSALPVCGWIACKAGDPVSEAPERRKRRHRKHRPNSRTAPRSYAMAHLPTLSGTQVTVFRSQIPRPVNLIH